MKVVIQSYKRVDLLRRKTYKLLKKYGVDDKDIYIFVAPQEMDEYKEAFPDTNIVRSYDDFMKTRKHTLTYFKTGTKFLQMDDDITSIVKLSGDKTKPITSLKKLYDLVFKTLDKTGLRIAGLYPTPNPLWMAKQKPITTDLRFLYDSVIFINVDNKILPSIAAKEDYEMSILYYKKYGGVVRFNHYSFRASYTGGEGGRDRSKDKIDSDRFIKKYGDFISNVITHSDGTTSFVLKKNP